MIKVYSHPRSGTNFLAALLGINLYPKKASLGKLATRAGYVGHWADRAQVPGNQYGRLFGGHGLPRRYKILKPRDCYIYRDGRDVALSLWNSKHFVNPEWKRTMDFSQFIRAPLDWVSSPGDKASPGLNIFEHWKRHLELWRTAGVQLICYEDLVQNPGLIVQQIAKKAGRKLTTVEWVQKPAGWFPSGGRVGAWRTAMNGNDIAYFHYTVGDCYGVYR